MLQLVLASLKAFPPEVKKQRDQLKQRFYDVLCNDHGYVPLTKPLTPGAIDGVTKEGIEITGLSLPRGVRIDINVPVDAPATALYHRVSCGRIDYLSAKEEMFVTEDNLEDQVANTIALANPGIFLARRYKDRII